MVFSRVQMRRFINCGLVYGFIPVLVAILASCSSYNKVYKGKNYDAKYKLAVQLYNKTKKRHWDDARLLFEQLKDYYKNTDSIETVYYYLAQCHLKLEDYEYAGFYFKDYAENFDKAGRKEESEFLAVFCQYKMIGSHELDQSETAKTIGALQEYINKHPSSNVYSQKCTEYIADLRKKLQRKAYDKVMQYYHMGEYKAAQSLAVITLRDYPDIDQKEQLEFVAFNSQFTYAMASVEGKRRERLKLAVELYEDYMKANPTQGEYFVQVQNIKRKIDAEIKRLIEQEI